MTDEKLYELCRRYGAQALEARRKFLGLLPEVYKRKLYEKKGCSSIFEFAAKLAGVSHEQVRRVLNLKEKFADKPVLEALLVEGEVSANKLAKIASIATVENQEFLADQVRLLSCRAVETLVRDQKWTGENQKGLQEQLFEAKSVHVNTPKLDDDINEQLYELQRKGIDINQLIREMLQLRKTEISATKEKLSCEAQQTDSRYVPVAVKNILFEEYGDKCGVRTCDKPSRETHHIQRFGFEQIHDCKLMVRYCSEHHEIAHTIDVKYHEVRLRGR